jgi:DNA-binding NarL/FixJ family response regulator
MFANFESSHLRREALSAGLSAIVSKDESIAALASSIQALLEPVS